MIKLVFVGALGTRRRFALRSSGNPRIDTWRIKKVSCGKGKRPSFTTIAMRNTYLNSKLDKR